jgi:hypothetical protein
MKQQMHADLTNCRNIIAQKWHNKTNSVLLIAMLLIQEEFFLLQKM